MRGSLAGPRFRRNRRVAGGYPDGLKGGVTFAAALTLELADEQATAGLAARVAARARAGDVVALAGPLGAGKTSFARAFIRARGDGAEEVPSPTFTLVQVYPCGDGPAVWHFDLYRLKDPEEAWELGIEDAFGEAISLIEWPERLGALLPAEHLNLALAFGADADARVASLGATSSWAARLAGLVDG
jgi:tRNA threonylcarbamoyladenosine biosynthesis protein TsaE